MSLINTLILQLIKMALLSVIYAPPYVTIVVWKARRDLAPQIMIVICYDLMKTVSMKQSRHSLCLSAVSLHCPSDGQTEMVKTHTRVWMHVL